MSKWSVHPLRRSDAPAARTLAGALYLDQLHPLDQPLITAAAARRRLARRFRSDIITATASCGVFANDQLYAFALYGDARHPLTNLQERHILDLVDASADEMALGVLIAALVEQARTDGVDILRAELSAHGASAERKRQTAQELGFIDDHFILRRIVGPRHLEAGHFELTSDEHRPFALDCLTHGIANALADESIDFERIARFTARRFSRLQTNRQLSIIALGEDGIPRGHAIVELVPATFRNAVEASLGDIFVPQEWKGEGWSIRLWRYVENLLSTRGIDRAEGTLVLNGAPAPEQLRASLQQEGWWVDRFSLLLRLFSRASQRSVSSSHARRAPLAPE